MKIRTGIFLIVLLLTLDWGSKFIADTYLLPWTGGGDIYYFSVIYNTAITDGRELWVLGQTLSFCVLAWVWTTRISACGLCFLTAGAIGNSVEMFINGRVVDFIGVKVGPGVYEIFNLADIFIVTSLGIILVSAIMGVIRSNMRIWDLILGSRWIDYGKELGWESVNKSINNQDCETNQE